MRSVMRQCVMVATLSGMTGNLAAPAGTPDGPREEAPESRIRDVVDMTGKKGKHSHVWLVRLPVLEGTGPENLSLTVMFGPGCGPPTSIWRRLAAGVVAAGAASLRSRAASAIAGTLADSFVLSPSRHSTFPGRKLRHIGDRWYALTFRCRHQPEAGAPSARLLIFAPGIGPSVEPVLATPWRPLAPGAPVTAKAAE